MNIRKKFRALMGGKRLVLRDSDVGVRDRRAGSVEDPPAGEDSPHGREPIDHG